jgi:cytochrome c553
VNRRLTHILVTIVTAAVLVAVVAFGFVVSVPGRAGSGSGVARRAVPVVTHAVDESTADCSSCHAPDREGAPPGHASYGIATCLSCHAIAPDSTNVERGARRADPVGAASPGR